MGAVGAGPKDMHAVWIPAEGALVIRCLSKIGTRLPMGAKCGKVTSCGLWVQRSNAGCCSLFEQSSGVGSSEARLSPINGWQVREQRLTAYILLYFTSGADSHAFHQLSTPNVSNSPCFSLALDINIKRNA